MTRLVFAPAAVFLCWSLTAAPAAAQAAKTSPPATKTTPPAAAKSEPAKSEPAPAAPAKFVKPIKGVAAVSYIPSNPKRVGNDMVTTIKIKNTSAGAIGLFTIDEYWYDKTRKVVTGDTCKIRKPFNPGDIVECVLKSPIKPDLYQNQFQFSHAGGEIKPTKVTKF